MNCPEPRTASRAMRLAHVVFESRRRLVAGVLALTAAAIVMLANGSLTVDNYPQLHTYGFSVGTTTHYCSVENTGVSCEVAQ